jgi:O-antigen ligase
MTRVRLTPLTVACIAACLLALILFLVQGSATFTDPNMLATLIVGELILAAVWNYRSRFFPVLLAAFLWAGIDAPLNLAWTSGRWVVLAVAALIGFVVYIKDCQLRLTVFHLVALACIAAALISALVSTHPDVALLKALSLLLLFLYGSTGARLAVLGREREFFSHLLLGCEWMVYLSAIAYFIFRVAVFGNPNSLGVVMGVVAVPVLLWGILVAHQPSQRSRYICAFTLSLLLLFSSYARAGIVAAAFAGVLMCFSLRRYKLFVKGVCLSLLLASVVATVVPRLDQPSDSLTSTFIYKGRRDQGVFASRHSVWNSTVAEIRQHPWFGSGFGTSKTSDEEPSSALGAFTSAAIVTREHGNSYLAITEWVGLLGDVPFLGLLLLVLLNIGRVVLWMRRVGHASSPAVPVAMVLAAGLVHAAFEDWLFAVGYYLCVFFWAFAFILIDLVARPVPVLAPPSFHAAPQWSGYLQAHSSAPHASVF